ncbi:MAG: hypothetical protein LKJ90_08750 [Faecalibacterium sp.]|nr:hypothetical protein [Faecalibacterium sp.]
MENVEFNRSPPRKCLTFPLFPQGFQQVENKYSAENEIYVKYKMLYERRGRIDTGHAGQYCICGRAAAARNAAVYVENTLALCYTFGCIESIFHNKENLK